MENGSKEFSPTEISYGVKQLLMKYLPDEHLAKVAVKPNQPESKGNGKDMHCLMERKHDFSFASLQYMKKYNLLQSSGNFFQVYVHKYKIIYIKYKKSAISNSS